MKHQVLLIELVFVAVLAALPLAESKGRPKPAPLPCCDNCGACTRSLPPQCFCSDASPRRCHPACKSCEKSIGNDRKPVFQCKDLVTYFCQRRCTPAWRGETCHMRTGGY